MIVSNEGCSNEGCSGGGCSNDGCSVIEWIYLVPWLCVRRGGDGAVTAVGSSQELLATGRDRPIVTRPLAPSRPRALSPSHSHLHSLPPTFALC